MATRADRYMVLPDELIASKFGTAIDYDKVDQLIDGRAAYDLIWARGLRCTCRPNLQSDQPDPTCPVCLGRGVRYVHPDPENWSEWCAADGSVTETADQHGGTPIRGLMDGVSLHPDWKQPGLWAAGRASLTVKGIVEIGHMDRVIMVDALMPFDQNLLRDAGVGTIPVGRDAEHALRFPVVKVVALHTLTTRYRLRTDFLVNENGTISWVTGRGPATDERFTIRYTFHPSWVVIDFPKIMMGARRSAKQTGANKDIYQPLPTSCTVQLSFLED